MKITTSDNIRIQPRLKVFDVVNHVGSQYELLKLAKKYPVKFYYLSNNVRRWSEYSARPEPTTWLSEDEFEWVPYYEPGKYDVAILRTDQQHVNPDIGKGKLFRDMNEVIQDIPKIVCNHGTPDYTEMYPEDIVINGGQVHTKSGKKWIAGMRQLVGDATMVVNSYDSVDRWGWGYPIIHGMDKNEWWDLPKEPKITISLSPGGLDHYYNRQLLTAIKEEILEKLGTQLIHITVNYQCKDWGDYRRQIGNSLIYINPTKDSPMPRSRTEAMLSGSCVLTSRYHNADEFIKHGENGFIVPDNPLSYAEACEQLINHNYREAVKIGQRGKQTAQEIFDIDRYLDDWWWLINEVKDGRKPTWQGDKIW